MVITDKHILFWGQWPSNFAWSPMDALTSDGHRRRFFSVEQFYAWSKAMFFSDIETVELIEKLDFYEGRSDLAKRLGRTTTKDFDEEAWNAVSYDIMLRGCLSKFSQNKVLFDKITDLALDGKKFVEASPVDLIWGIGLREGDPLADDEKNWKGQNRLGKVLDEVREKLLDGYREDLKY